MARKITRDGLMLWWDGLNNTSEGTHGDTSAWYDLSGNHNHGLFNPNLNQGSYFKWKDNHATFTSVGGVDSSLKWKDIISKPEMTLEMTLSSMTSGIIHDANNYGRLIRQIYFTSVTSDKTRYYAVVEVTKKYSVEEVLVLLPFDYDTETPFTLTITVKNNLYCFYVNGLIINSFLNNEPGDLSFTDETYAVFMAGYDGTYSGGHFLWNNGADGNLYSVRIYDRALTDNEVYYNYMAEMDHLKDPEEQVYPDIPIVRPDGSIIDPVQDGEVSRVAIGDNEIYNVKDIKARTTKLDKYKDEQVYGVVSFINGIQVDVASIKYDPANNTVVFK